MNKLFTKIAALCLGATMAVGVGVAVASNTKANPVRAANPGDSITWTWTASSSNKLSAGNSTVTGNNGTVSITTAVTGGAIQNSYQSTYNGQQMGTGSSNMTNFTITFGNPWNGTGTYKDYTKITSVSLAGCCGASTSYTVSATVDGVAATNTNSTTTLHVGTGTPNTCTFAPASGHESGVIVLRVQKSSGSKAWYLSSFSITAEVPASSGYSIASTITNGTATGATSISEGGSASVTITPNSGYKLPSDVTVTGATKSYNSSTGVVTLSSPTGNVTITATCPALQSYTIAKTITHGSASGATSITENGNASVTITPDSGYKLPSTVSVTGATSSYNATTGVVSLSNPTGNVTVSATMDAASQYSISYSLTRLTASPSPTTMYENAEVSITLSVTDSTKYALPTSVTVTNSTGYGYNSSTGVVSLHGSQGNVTITASAIEKPAEASEEFDFTNYSLWDDSKKDDNGDTIYSRTVDLVTVTWESNKQSSKAGAYWNPGRIYKNHLVTISAVTGTGAVTTIKSVIFHIYDSTANYRSGLTGATVSGVVGGGSISSKTDTSSGSDYNVTYTTTGTVTKFVLSPSAQTRWTTVEVVYMKDQSDITLNSITATCNPVLVSQTIKPSITFNPQNATNKNVSYAIVENTGNLASVAEDGTITGLGSGTARLKITPEDTNASAITIDVTINALPNIYGVEVGKKYAMVKDGYELSGIYESATPNYGTVASYSGNPAGTFPIRIVNGLYARTVALQVEINSETKYLSYDAALNGNSLNYVSEINRESSWIFAEVDSALLVRNVEVYGRYLAFSSNRFACYQALSSSIVTPEFVELAEEKTDKEYVQDFVDLYMHMNDYTENKGWCSDGEHSYYLTAKAGYNSIIYDVAAREALWTGDSDFAAAKLRYETWAVKNNDNDPYDGNDTVVDKIDPNKSKIIFESVLGQNSNTIAIIVIISMISVTTIGGYFFLRKRKEN